MTPTVRIAEISVLVAMNAKASGIGIRDLGCFYDDEWNLTDSEWDAVCDQVGGIYDEVEPPASLYRSWTKVNANFRAEEAAERRVCYGEQAYFNDL